MTEELLERLVDAIEDIEVPDDHLDLHVDVAAEAETECDVCGREVSYGSTFRPRAFDFDRVCVQCVGDYLDTGDWDLLEDPETVQGQIDFAQTALRRVRFEILYSTYTAEDEDVDVELDPYGISEIQEELTSLASAIEEPTHPLPAAWPEMYSAAGRSADCPHEMQWNEAEGRYECIHGCGEVDEVPPPAKRSATHR